MTDDRLDDLRAALAGVRGFVLDADGVLVLKAAPLPGSAEALRVLESRGTPFRIVTNFSQLHRSSLGGWFAKGGLTVDPERIITAASATAAYTAATYPDRPIVILSAPDAAREFDGQYVLGPDEASAAAEGSVAAVVIGDAGDELSFGNVNLAFRLVRGGAELLAMHRNPWWHTPDGITIDAGAFVAALEFATGKRARTLGKPSPDVFRQAAAGLQRDLGKRAPRSAFAMVGDDLDADVAAAKRVGLRGILVLSGKTTAAEADRASDEPGGARRRRPDGIAATLADVVAALD
jgi:HAD superfamily hydrolase (TIGR01450 family)